MCRAQDDPTCTHRNQLRCEVTDPVVSASRGKAYEASKKGEGLTAAATALAAVALLSAPVTSDTRDIEALRSLASSIDKAFAGEDQDAIAELSRDYGSPLGGIRALGAAMTSRGEELAGITADEATDSWHRRKDAAEQTISDLAEARFERGEEDMVDFDAWSAEHHPGVNWQDTSGEGSLRQLRNRYVSDEYKVAAAASTEAEDDWAKGGLPYGKDTESRSDLRRISDGCAAALAEIRPLGGHLEFHELSDAPAVLAVAEASSIYPADWNTASAEAGPLAAAVTEGRAKHSSISISSDSVASTAMSTVERPAGSVPMDTPEMTYVSVEKGTDHKGRPDPAHDTWTGQAWEVKRVKGKPKGYDWEAVEPGVWRRKPRGTIKGAGVMVGMKGAPLPGRPKGFAEAAHELGHQMQVVVPGLSSMEHAWLTDRTTVNGVQEPLVPRWEGGDEYVRVDNFHNAYVGREYTDRMGDPRETTEVITVGVQSIFGGDDSGLIGLGSLKRDDDMRHFVLGSMASAGYRR